MSAFFPFAVLLIAAMSWASAFLAALLAVWIDKDGGLKMLGRLKELIDGMDQARRSTVVRIAFIFIIFVVDSDI